MKLIGFPFALVVLLIGFGGIALNVNWFYLALAIVLVLVIEIIFCW